MKAGTALLPFAPPELHEGPEALDHQAVSIAAAGHRRLLLVTDAVLVDLGIAGRVIEALDRVGVEAVVFDEVTPDPTIGLVEAGERRALAEGVDGVIGVGGGSPLDAAKAIAALATNPHGARAMNGLFRLLRKPLPIHAVPTTAGTGSETTFAAVITDAERSSKMTLIDVRLTPRTAALDGSLMVGLPPGLTAATGMDALTHAVEAYLSRNATRSTDSLALGAARCIARELPGLVDDGSDVAARQRMARASFDAGAAFTIAGVGYVHAIAHQLGARYHVPHGVANAQVMPAVLRMQAPACTSRLAALARVSGLPERSEAEAAEAFIAHVEALNERFRIPSSIGEIRAEDIPAIVEGALTEAHTTYAVPRYMDPATCALLVADLMP